MIPPMPMRDVPMPLRELEGATTDRAMRPRRAPTRILLHPPACELKIETLARTTDPGPSDHVFNDPLQMILKAEGCSSVPSRNTSKTMSAFSAV